MCIHKWAKAEMTEGMQKRQVIDRRVCLKCGRVDIKKLDFGRRKWYVNRYVNPKEIRVLVPKPTEEDC